MLEIFKTLKETPLPIVLVIGGLIFLLIPFIQKINAKEVGVETTNHFFAGIIGFILLVTGIGLYIIPSGTSASTLPTETPSQVIQPTELPTNIPALPPTSISQPTIAVVIPTNAPQIIIPTASPVKVDVVGNNLVQNAGFESGMYSGGWEWGQPTVNIQSGHDSSSSLCSKQELQANQNAGWVGFHQNVPVSGNQKYTLSAWVKLQNASQVHIKILWFDSNFAEISNNFIMGGTDGTSDWSQHGGVATSPVNAVTARLIFWHGVKVGDINVPNSFMCIDDVFFATIQ
ncbi:MAG: hypothetical protein Q8L64_00275 [bacterium]|nr:hypothetical protein [bacterium]